MRNKSKFLGALLVLSMVGLPAYAAAESVGVGELTQRDFTWSSAGKPVQAWELYRRYKYSLEHPAPMPTLETSRMRTDESERLFQGNAGTKPLIMGAQKREVMPSVPGQVIYVGQSDASKPIVNVRR